MSDYELYHFGVKGMKWGVRKKRVKSGRRKSTSTKQYTPDSIDEVLYGERGAKRIAKNRSKGQSHVVARGREAARQAITTTVGAVLMMDLMINDGRGTRAAASGVVNAVKNGKKVVDDFISRNGSILDASGKIIRGYNAQARDVTGMFDLAVRR